MFADKRNNLMSGPRTLFLGVLFSGPVIQTDGKIVIRNIPTADVPVAQINLTMNLGCIVKAKELQKNYLHCTPQCLPRSDLSHPHRSSSRSPFNRAGF